jgi:hypothetical protein
MKTLCSVEDLDPGPGIQCYFDPWIRDPESEMGSRIQDTGSGSESGEAKPDPRSGVKISDIIKSH